MRIASYLMAATVGLVAAGCSGKTSGDDASTPAAAEVSVPSDIVTGTLRIGTSVPEADIIVDNELRGKGRVSITLPAGSHRLVVQAAGFTRIERSVTVRANDVSTETVILKRAANPTRPSP